MSGSVTPARRSYGDIDEEEDFEVSVDGESTPKSNPSKRARLAERRQDLDEDEDEHEHDDEDGEGNDDEDDESEAPLLPDSFRRSPKGKARANGHSRADAPKKHQPGSIVRVTLTDFVTYTKAEFLPGPNLNMVIGPNGTGKSTLVCAICIGLGWATKHLGRGKELDEFVKHGAKSGTIEIELAADPARHDTNPIITTRIKKGDKNNASDYWINGKRENKKRVTELCQSFSIQVDNLCQFLPQDRVVEFAGLSPVDLLAETQRAAAPQHMTDWHEELKQHRKEQKEKELHHQSLAERIKKLEDRQRSQQPDVERIRERNTMQQRLQALEKMRPLPEYYLAKETHKNAKQRRKDAEKELKNLKNLNEPKLAAIGQQEDYSAAVSKALASQRRMVERLSAANSPMIEAKKKMAEADGKIKDCADERKAGDNSMKTVKQSMPGLLRSVNDIKKAMERPPEPFDPAQLNEQVREKSRQMRDLDEKVNALNHEVGSLGHQMTQRNQIIEDAEREKADMQSQAGQKMGKLQSVSADAAKAWDWIQNHRDKFRGEVFGPPLVECSVKNERHAPAVESMVQLGDALAFTVTTKADFDMLTDELHKLKLRQINVRASFRGLETYQPPTTKDALQQYGLEGWLLELLEGPEPVLAMLCDNRAIHQTAYTFGELSSSQFNAVQRSPINSWVTSKQSHSITRRREYGDKATSTRVQDLKQARFFTKVSVDHQRTSNIDRRVAETRDEIETLRESRLAKMGEAKEAERQSRELGKEKAEIQAEKNTKQNQLSHFNALPLKLENAESKVSDAREKLAGSAQRLKAISKKLQDATLEKGQGTLNYANQVEQLRVQCTRLFENEVLAIEATSELEQLRARHKEEADLIAATEQEVASLTVRDAELLSDGKRLQEQCLELQQHLTPDEQKVWEEISGWDLDQLTTAIASLAASLDSLVGGGNQRTIDEFESRQRDIEEKTREFHALNTALETLQATITDIREQWEPELDALVEEISEAFADNFAQIHCAGEVGVYKDDDFEKWAIQIRVKFRESEPLSLLDNHRQSGGERAVSTIFYLMALQTLARAPFRVVDEINQGMDPRNERLVHSRMVDIACSAVGEEGRQGSQYFLITPKLLQGLKYHPDMKVHCIASGEHMPSDHRAVDFERAAKRALEVRGRRSAGVAAG